MKPEQIAACIPYETNDDDISQVRAGSYAWVAADEASMCRRHEFASSASEVTPATSAREASRPSYP